MALQLIRNVGVRKVRPLAGGFERWRALGFPIQPVSEDMLELAVPVLPE